MILVNQQNHVCKLNFNNQFFNVCVLAAPQTFVHVNPLEVPKNSPKSSQENLLAESVDDKKKKTHWYTTK